MCLKKKVFLDILDKFPDASNFYKDRARDRRIEFRRVKKMFLLETGVNDESDDEDKELNNKKENICYYTEKENNMPPFLSDLYYFLSKPEPSIRDEDLEKESDDEIVERKHDKEAINLMNK